MKEDFYKPWKKYDLDILKNENFYKYRSYSLYKLTESINKKNINMIEIGSYSGTSSNIFLLTGFVDKITCIDPWCSQIKEAELKFDERYKNETRVIKFKGTIDKYVISKEFKDNKDIDLIYIDGNHNYEYVKNDILKTQQYIKPKYAISGHDYSEEKFPGVFKAVNELLGEPDIWYADHSWIKFLS